jgi:hypothetical protein
MRKAKAAFETVIAADAAGRAGRAARSRMALMCRSAIDKAFVEGAKLTEAYQDSVARALVDGRERPAPPTPRHFLTVRVGAQDMLVYLPVAYAERAFNAGARYQRAEIDATTAVELVQKVLDDFCMVELDVDDELSALQFLRDEIAPPQEDTDAAADAAPDPASGQTNDSGPRP